MKTIFISALLVYIITSMLSVYSDWRRNITYNYSIDKLIAEAFECAATLTFLGMVLFTVFATVIEAYKIW